MKTTKNRNLIASVLLIAGVALFHSSARAEPACADAVADFDDYLNIADKGGEERKIVALGRVAMQSCMSFVNRESKPAVRTIVRNAKDRCDRTAAPNSVATAKCYVKVADLATQIAL